ncbi:MAG: putative metal-binding motif-containing protein, partial [Myxococcales bacterium]|nr:putative metal-binding motif-containing protein [Myxococcales bacterium]
CDADFDGDGVVPPADCAPRDAPRFDGAAERCDNLDQDCDGSVDEGLERGCYPGPAGTRGVGQCADGREVCGAGEWGPCLEASLPAAEACDGADEDCDGLVDEALVAACYSGPEGTEGVGVCAGGGAVCAEGVFGACEGEVLPAAEVCNQLDDDCDGVADEALDCVCPAAHTTIDSQADVDALNASGCNEVAGDLVVNPGAPAVVRLPNIVRVLNNVILFGTTERVELPALREIGSELQILGDFLHHVALPELEVAESIYVDSLDLIELVLPRLRLSATVWVERSGLVRIALPVLSAGHTVRINSNPNLATLDLPLLESASAIDLSGNHLLRVLEFPALVRVWEDLQIGSNDGLRRLAAPLLVTAAGNRSVTLTMNPLLDEIEFPSYVGPPIVVVFNEAWPQCLRPAAFPLLDPEGSDIRGNRIDCVCDVVDGSLVATCPD